MADNLTKEQRSFNMSRVRGKDTKPEKLVRSLVHSLGFRFRKHVKELPGKPDIVLPKYKSVIQIHGCFWHQHKNCEKSHLPKSNVDYWKDKLSKNIKRDKTNYKKLSDCGWSILIIWECEVKKNDNLTERIINFLRPIKNN